MSPSLILHNNESLLNQIMTCDAKWILYHNQLSGWTEKKQSSRALLKAKSAQKIGHGHCSVVCCLSNPRQLSKSQWNHYIWEVCSANRWDTPKTAMTVLVNRMGPILHNVPNCTSCNQLFKSLTGLWSFASPTIFTWSRVNQLPLLKASQQPSFASKMLPQPAGGDTFQKLVNLEQIWINKLVSCLQQCGHCLMVPVLINKDVLEPSYDLKFMVGSNLLLYQLDMFVSIRLPFKPIK